MHIFVKTFLYTILHMQVFILDLEEQIPQHFKHYPWKIQALWRQHNKAFQQNAMNTHFTFNWIFIKRSWPQRKCMPCLPALTHLPVPTTKVEKSSSACWLRGRRVRRSKGKGMKEMVDSRCFSSSSVCPAVWRRPGVDGGLRKKERKKGIIKMTCS